MFTIYNLRSTKSACQELEGNQSSDLGKFYLAEVMHKSHLGVSRPSISQFKQAIQSESNSRTYRRNFGGKESIKETNLLKRIQCRPDSRNTKKKEEKYHTRKWKHHG